MSKSSIIVDGKTYSVNSDQNLLRACLSAGLNVPYFCWHPALESVGACRQCAVKAFKDETDTRGKIIMSCMTPVSDGMRLSIDDAEVANFRARNIEWLMLNHPHDCPVCDEGGECHLQDMTVMTGHTNRRTRFRKRTYQNQDLGPFINHEMNRCIQCYRCVRFYRDFASGRDFDVFACHDSVYFGRHADGALENNFSGNLVEICPTGVFTDKTEKKHFTRKWDLQTAPSVCVHCSLGCNTIPGERYGELRRVRNRFNGSVNGYFLCDRGRFGYEFVNSPERIRESSYRERPNSTGSPMEKDAVMEFLRKVLTDKRRFIGIGSPRASIEANFALRKFVGSERFFAGVPLQEYALVSRMIDIMKGGPVPAASLAEAASSDAVFILGEDVTNTAPMLALNILQACRNKPMKVADNLHIPRWEDRATREATQHRKGPLFVAAPADTWLDSRAEAVFRGAPQDIGRLGFAVAHALHSDCPEVAGLNNKTTELARTIADTLKKADYPLIISGSGVSDESIICAAANVAWALSTHRGQTRLSFVAPECNSIGLALMSARPLDDALDAVEKGQADIMIILENDLLRKGDKQRIAACLKKCKHVIILDHVFHDTATYADLVLPAATFAESTGTFVNNEGRGQRFFQVFVPESNVRPSWQWIRECMVISGAAEGRSWQTIDNLVTSISEELPAFKHIADVAPPADFRKVGLKVARQTHRASGRTSMHADISVHEPTPPDDPDSALAFSMEGYQGDSAAALITRFWAPGWNSVQALNKFQVEVGGPLHGGDPGKRFIEPEKNSRPCYYEPIPTAFSPADALLAVPLYHIFGSEELSMFCPSIRTRAPYPYVLLNPEDAARLDVHKGEKVQIVFGHAISQETASVLLSTEFPKGIAGLPSGLPAFGTVSVGSIELRKTDP